jgi:hypothetical protein
MGAVDAEQEREKQRQVNAADRALTAMQHVHAGISAYCSVPAIGEFGGADTATAGPPTDPPDRCGLTTHSQLRRFMGPHGHKTR